LAVKIDPKSDSGFGNVTRIEILGILVSATTGPEAIHEDRFDRRRFQGTNIFTHANERDGIFTEKKISGSKFETGLAEVFYILHANRLIG
jgi:hypothetical protein